LSLKFPNAKLEGFDFAPTHFSAKELLPTNVSLNELDILDDIPDQLHSAFSIIDIRAFSTCILQGETRLLHVVQTMLQPDGCFQWIKATTGKCTP
jgi:hypothetical protein